MLPGALPYSLGIPPGSSTLYDLTGVSYSYALAGLPWLSAASKDHPIIRATAPFKKQQFDSSQEPGEQSLDGWWLRSQQSWHGGAGQLYGDPSSGDASFSAIRYYRSKGVNPWTPGQISLLPRVTGITSDSIHNVKSDGVRACGILDSGDVYFVDPTGAYTTDSTLLGVGFLPPMDITLDSHNYYLATGYEVYYRAISDPSISTWHVIYSFGGGPHTPTIVEWVKERLVMANDTGIYELTDLDGAPGANVLPAPKWTPPQGSWEPTGIAESNSAIYVAGILGGSRSIILKFTLDNTGAMPTLTSGTVVANLPQGEMINSIYGYLGKFLAISTSLGPRIALIDDNGDLQVGPTVFSGATGNWTARGQYLYAPAVLPEWDPGQGGAVRVDVGLEFTDLRFAYASDIYTAAAGDGATGVGLIAAGLLLGTDGGLYLESSTELLDSGWVQGSRIRYSTLEPKLYKFVRARGSVLHSDFFISVVDVNGAEYPVVGYTAGQTPGMEDVPIPDLGPLDCLSVKITLSSTADNLTSAVTSGYQLKALPAQPRQRQIVLPVYCFDQESDSNGVEITSSALTRLLALEAVDEAADTVILQDFTSDTASLVSIDSIEFRQTVPPPGFDGFGGIIQLTLRTV